MSSNLVLSLFPGIGLLDMAFEEAGFCVVRGPDVLWGGDIHTFHPPAGRFDGVIGGPPCQAFTSTAFVVRANGDAPQHPNLIPEYERVVAEAAPRWFAMEEVPDAPEPVVEGYGVRSAVLNNRLLGGEQHRRRRISFGLRGGSTSLLPFLPLWEPVAGTWSPAVTGDMRTGEGVRTKPGGGKMPHTGPRVPLAEMCRLQGLPADFLSEAPFTENAKRQIVGNGVPLPLGRAIAKAVKEALASLERREAA